MSYQSTLNEYLQVIVGKKLENLGLACEMMVFSFEDYAFHALGLTRIIKDNDILVTTLDYQNWDRKNDENNDESYFVKKYRDRIEGGIVISVTCNINLTHLHGCKCRLMAFRRYSGAAACVNKHFNLRIICFEYHCV